MKNLLSSISYKNILALFAGTLLTLACAPFNLFPLALLSSATLLYLWLDTSKKQAFRYGFYYGLGLFGSGVYWIFISMHTYAELPVLGAGTLTALLIACLALFPALHGWLLNHLFPRTNHAKILCAFPALWVFLEWIRSWLFSGFPWLFIGYSQTNFPLRGYAPLLSIYGVSLATVMSGALLANAYRCFNQKQKQLLYWSLASFSIIWIIGSLLSLVQWTQPTGTPIQVSLIQANIPQQLKWSSGQIQPTLNQYKLLSQNHWDSNIVIWPEAAIPIPLEDAAAFVDDMSTIAKKHHAVLITGVPVKNANNNYFNAVISVGYQESGFYLKRHLVPFGEYVPFQQWLGRIFNFLHIPMSDFSAGPAIMEPIKLLQGIKLSTAICYEIAFPELMLASIKKIGLILTVTNDAWFGHSIAQAQHLQMAQMRAIELGKPVLFASNNGITALISASGKIESAAPPFKTSVLTGKVRPYQGNTPWARYPMDPILLIIIGLLFTAYRHRRA